MPESKPEDLQVMRQVLAGKVRRQDIPNLTSRQLRLHAAVAYILLNHKEYLDLGCGLRQPYGKLLNELMQEPPDILDDILVQQSRRLGLHVPAVPRSVRKVVLLPPPELNLKHFYTKNPSFSKQVTELTEAVFGAGLANAYEVYKRLDVYFG